MNEPDIIFGDEPTGSLDSRSTAIRYNIFQWQPKGKTIMIVTHDAKVAAKTEKILFMVDGMIVAQKRMSKYNEQHSDLKKREESIMKMVS